MQLQQPGSPVAGVAGGMAASPGGAVLPATVAVAASPAGVSPVTVADAAAAGCCGTGGAAVCGGTAGGGSMKYVGSGGNYVIETTYKYVGGGGGDYDLSGPPASRWPLCLGGALLVAAAVILVLLIFPDTTSTTWKLDGDLKDCFIWGDPHVKSFDNSYPNFYGEGEFWIIKNPEFKVQGRFSATPFTKGLAALSSISVGYQNHIFTVDAMNGDITCDGGVALQGFPSQGSCGSVSLEYNDRGRLVDEAQANLPRRIVHIDVPNAGIHMNVMRWANHLNVWISKAAEGAIELDGVCGNDNGNAEDDSTASIMQRLGGRVAQEELLFQHRMTAHGMPSMTIADCDDAKRAHALEICRQDAKGADAALLNSCIFDVCFGGDQYAEEDGLTIEQVVNN